MSGLLKNINLIKFDTDIGSTKPENIIHSENDCPFCDVEHLTDIIDTDGDIIFLKNKYNVVKGADQFVLIEGSECSVDMPDYSNEHMRRVIRLGLKYWKRLLECGKYEEVLFFKNFGPMSGGTIRHPHMQLVGFPELKSELLFFPEEKLMFLTAPELVLVKLISFLRLMAILILFLILFKLASII